jgi:predicted Ser/Thr protein kinase
VKPEARRICQLCGAQIPAATDVCPICALQGALKDNHLVGESAVDMPPSASTLRFEHYEVLTRENGEPYELGRGAMGITYKAFDVKLRCPVALKVVDARYLGDDSIRSRFLREARTAAKIRHPNVAAVFYLGNSQEIYFYTMEFVDGETLRDLIKRSGRLEAKLALEIAGL